MLWTLKQFVPSYTDGAEHQTRDGDLAIPLSVLAPAATGLRADRF